ncbi:hypothetical protein KKF82_04485 [Patescibacteria group bacterium]|nr:hypothetical protein [Patescibacteria group bacterium]
MRFIQTKPSGKDKNIPVFVFSLGAIEMKLLLGVCKTARKNLPDMLEKYPMRSRLGNIIKVLQKTLEEYNEENK